MAFSLNQEWALKVQAYRQVEIEGYARNHGFQISEYEQKANLHLSSFIRAMNPYMRVNSTVLESVLVDGFFKNQFQTGTSQGLLSHIHRANTEAALF